MTARARPEDFAESFRLKAIAYARAEGDALRAEKAAKRTFSQIVLAKEGSISAREHEARTSRIFVEAEDKMIDLQTAANVLKAELESMKISWETWRTLQANRRQEMKL